MHKRRVALAVAAHPDDIEFQMAGTLLLLGQRGYELHYMNVSSGNCGSMTMTPARTRSIRRTESRRAAKLLGAVYHPSVADDLEIVYNVATLRRLSAVMRAVNPTILLIPSPQDYMEDHTNTCRLAVTAAFSKGMPNFQAHPPREPVEGDVTLYHAMPHGLRDPLRQSVKPELFVDTTSVLDLKRSALAAHHSQKAWLDATQGMDSYLKVMEEMSLELGRMSRKFKHAEGWRRHLHYGFSARDEDPLLGELGNLIVRNKSYLAA